MTIGRPLPICSLMAATAILLTSCRTALTPGVPGAEFATITVRNGSAVAVETQRISVHPPRKPTPPKPRPPQVLDKTNRIVDDWIRHRPGTDRVEVLIGFSDPDPKKHTEAMDSYVALVRKLGGEIVNTHDFISTFLVRLPISALSQLLASEPRVRYIEPNRVQLTRDMIPGTCKLAAGSVHSPSAVTISTIAGASRLDQFTDPSPIAVAQLDSGVDNHVNLPPGQIVKRDCLQTPCVNGGNDGCLNHGTPDAGILIANGVGVEPRGVLPGATVRSFKVIEQSGSCTVFSNADAFVRAIAEAKADPSVNIILTEFLTPGGPQAAVSVAADTAFDAGIPVVTAANPTPGVDASPANAHKVFPVSATTQLSATTVDGRTVPVIWGMTASETTSAGGTNLYCEQDGSSGAAPYAVAAALKLKKILLTLPTPMPDAPGNIYALLLALSEKIFGVSSRFLVLPPLGKYLTGSFDLAHGETVTAQVNVAANEKLRAAIWWPESATPGLHNEIHLEIFKPAPLNLLAKASSKSTKSVFQYVAVPLPFTSGQWELRITGKNVVAGPQKVYWAAFAGQ